MLATPPKILVQQTLHLMWSSLKSRYRKTFAGFFWVLINPLAMFGVQSLVFSRILKIEIPNFILFLAGGLIPWIFMVQTISMGTASLANQGNLLRAFRLHPLVLVGASVLDNFMNFVMSILLIAVPVMIFHDAPLSRLLYAPICLIPFVIGTYAITCYTALLNVFFRDTVFVLGFFFSIVFFLTPIFYPVELIPPHLRWMVDFNPFFHLFNPFRQAIYAENPFDWFRPFLRACLWALGLSLGSFLYWKRRINELYRYL